MRYSVEKATMRDVSAILPIYEKAREIMRSSGNPNQWGTTNPPVERLLEDINKGQLYVITEAGTIHGAFALVPGEDPTYRTIYDGSWSRGCPYYTIHRLAGDGSGGIFRACMECCRGTSDYLRIDTHRDNRIMQHLLEKAGFRRCGIIHLLNGEERIAYDKEI